MKNRKLKQDIYLLLIIIIVTIHTLLMCKSAVHSYNISTYKLIKKQELLEYYTRRKTFLFNMLRTIENEDLKLKIIFLYRNEIPHYKEDN